MSKIGIMGGTFDPIHNGHLLLGKQAYLEYSLDEVWYMPSANPPHKKDHRVTDETLRCEMVRLAIADYPGFKLSTFEIERGGTTYTADTLKLLKEAYPEDEFYFILGADSIYMIEGWYHPEEIIGHVIILVADRDFDQATKTMEEQIAYLMEKYHGDIRLLHCEEVDISSAQLRHMNAMGKPLYKYVPKAVDDYIQSHKLYQEEEQDE